MQIMPVFRSEAVPNFASVHTHSAKLSTTSRRKSCERRRSEYLHFGTAQMRVLSLASVPAGVRPVLLPYRLASVGVFFGVDK
jgi:hypothetical protein